MDLDTAINTRASCRNFIDKKVPIRLLHMLLESGSKAPSAGNLQDFRFIIVTDEDKKKEIAEASLKQLWMADAPILIVVCSDLKNVIRFYEDRAEYYALQDVSAAAENILLKATDLGLASNWISVFDENVVRRNLRLPENVKPYIIIPIGYTKEKPRHRKRHSVETFISFNTFGNRKYDLNLFPIIKYKREEQKQDVFTLIKDKLKKRKSRH